MLSKAWCWIFHRKLWYLIGVDEDDFFVYQLYFCKVCGATFEDTPFNPVEDEPL